MTRHARTHCRPNGVDIRLDASVADRIEVRGNLATLTEDVHDPRAELQDHAREQVGGDAVDGSLLAVATGEEAEAGRGPVPLGRVDRKSHRARASSEMLDSILEAHAFISV
jgi:hypothetical protein